jgi:hypothetical protein
LATFVLFSQQRSGTGALASFISGHPQVHNASEILNPYDIDHEDNFFSFWLRNNPERLLRERVSPSNIFINYIDILEKKYYDRHILLDIKFNSIRHILNYWDELHGFSEVGMPWLMYLFYINKYPVIYLHRENHLHRFISSKLAEATGVYRTNDRRSVAQAKIELDIGQMLDFIMKSEANHEYFMSMLGKFDRHLYITYAQTFSGSAIRPDVKVEIARFFGFPLLVDQEPHYVKLRSLALEKVVVNLPEVAVELERVGRTHYLDL